jgi:hypothetical protein
MSSKKSDKKQDKKTDPKVAHWLQLYLQAKLDGDKKMMEYYQKIITKLGGVIPK